MTFGDGYNLIDDNVTPPAPAAPVLHVLSGPHWQPPLAGGLLRQYPYLYKGGATFKIATAVWHFDNDLPAGASIYVVANTAGYYFDAKAAIVAADNRTVTVNDLVATGALPSAVTNFLPLIINSVVPIAP